MARKVILDVDPGIHDAVALTIAMFDSSLDVEAVTAVAGNVSAERASRNAQATIEQLDPPRLPRIGTATDPDFGLPSDARHLFGADGLGNANFEVAELVNQHPSEKLIADVVKAHPGEVTIVALGPLTNIARAFQRDPSLPGAIGRLVILGGTFEGPGNVTPAAEFNIYADPLAAKMVFRAPCTKTLIPLDLTSQIVFAYDFLERLPSEESRAGRFLRKILPFAYRSHHQHLGVEGILMHDVVALVAATNPELFTTEEFAAEVETTGDITTGATVIDRRKLPGQRRNLEVALQMDALAVNDCVLRGITRAAQATL